MKFTILIAVLLAGCASTRSELSVEVRQQQQKPEFVMVFKVMQ